MVFWKGIFSSSLLPFIPPPPHPGFQGPGTIEKMPQIHINELKHSSGHNPKLHSQHRPVCGYSGIQIRDQLAILIKVWQDNCSRVK